MDHHCTCKRITLVPKNPNLLFEQWLLEWKKCAKERGLKAEKTINYAIHNLRKYKVPLTTGQDCKILKGFGNKLCKMLDSKLAVYRKFEQDKQSRISKEQVLYENKDVLVAPHGTLIANSFCQSNSNHNLAIFSDEIQANHLVLLETQQSVKMGEEQKLLQSNQDNLEGNHNLYEHSPLLNEEPIVNTKCSIAVENNNKLSANNEELMQSSLTNLNKMPLEGSCGVHSNISVNLTDFTTNEVFKFDSNTFDIILCVDTQEVKRSNGSCQNDELLTFLQNYNVLYEVRHLNVGDYLWICQHLQSKREMVLPYVIERKRLDDFASSIKDGRYHEQKFRLKRIGYDNVTYIIEHYSKHVSLPLLTLQQAATNTAVQDQFNVKFTRNLKHTAKYLANFTQLLQTTFKGKVLSNYPTGMVADSKEASDVIYLTSFDDFNKAVLKNKSLRINELFIKMLLQIKGMSVEKAMAIVAKYPSPASLRRAYEVETQASAEKMLAKIQCNKKNVTVGFGLSKIMYDLFSKEI